MFQRLKNILIGEPLTHDDSGDGRYSTAIVWQPFPGKIFPTHKFLVYFR